MLYVQDLFWWLFRRSGASSQECTSLRDPGGTISVGKQAVAPDFDEAQRQDVQTKPAEELLQRKGHRSDLTVVGIVFIAEGDGVVLPIQNLQSVIGDGDPVSVAAQIGQDRWRTGKGPFGVNDPFLAIETTEPAGKGNRV